MRCKSRLRCRNPNGHRYPHPSFAEQRRSHEPRRYRIDSTRRAAHLRTSHRRALQYQFQFELFGCTTDSMLYLMDVVARLGGAIGQAAVMFGPYLLWRTPPESAQQYPKLEK